MRQLPHGHVVKGRYTILSLLGTGSFATVYLAEDANWKGKPVALKEIRTDLFTDEEYQQLNTHFLQEAAFLMTLRHEGLPKVVEFFAEGPCYYLALEWVAGKTMEETVQGLPSPVKELRMLDWAAQTAQVLGYLHDQKPYPVLLGDLKPSNIVVTYDDRCKVIDFGVARHITPNQEREFSLVSPGFSPPEQYSNFNVDQRSDIYAFGASFYWVLAPGRLDKFRFDFPPVRKRRPDVSEGTEVLLARCLMADPRLRIQNVAQLQAEIEKVRRGVAAEQSVTPAEILGALYRGKKKPAL